MTQATAATSSGPTASATQKFPPSARNTAYVRYAPSMYRLPCAKFRTRSTPKMSDRPAATSHRYIASVRPTRPWKRRTRPIGLDRLPLRLDGRERRLSVVLVRRRDAQIAEYRHGELRIVLDASPRYCVDRLVVLLANLAWARGTLHLHVLERRDDRVDVQRLCFFDRLLDRVQRRVRRLRHVARIAVPPFAERLDELLVLRRIRIPEVVAARRPRAVRIIGAEPLQHVHRGAH